MSQPGNQWGPPQWGPPQWGPPQWEPPAPPSPQWVPRAPSVLPEQPTSYPQFWRAPALTLWRPLVGTLLLAVAFLVASTVVTIAALGIEVLTGAVDPDAVFAVLERGEVTPGLVLGNSIAIGLMLPASLLVARLVRQPPRFLHSVVGRFRWRWFAVCAAASLGALLLTFGGELLLVPGSGEALDLQIHPYTWWLLVGLLLVTPFQAAAEEYMLRGVVLRTVGSWFRHPMAALVFGTAVNAGIFMLLHGAADPWLNLVYLVMGVLLSWITWRTGGLEAAVAFHIVNNMVAFSIVPFQDVAGLFDRSAGVAGPVVLIQLVAVVLVVLVMDRLARRQGLAQHGPAPAER